MKLEAIEQDILGDMAEDTHLLGEIFGSFRGANPAWTDEQVLVAGRGLIVSWLERGWLALSTMPTEQGPLKSVDELLPLIDRLGTEATWGVKNLWLGLTPKAYADVEWLGPAA